MTIKEMAQFLEGRGATQSQIEQIMRPTSPQAVLELYSKAGVVISLEQAEKIASAQRDRFVDIIKNDDLGNVPWDFIKNNLQ